MCVEATAFNLMQIGEITKLHSPKRSKDTGEKDTSCVLLLCKIQDAEAAKNPEKSSKKMKKVVDKRGIKEYIMQADL